MTHKDCSKLTKSELVEVRLDISNDLARCQMAQIRKYACSKNPDVRKNVYLILGLFYRDMKPYFKEAILETVSSFINDKDENVRNVAIYASREIGKVDLPALVELLEKATGDIRP